MPGTCLVRGVFCWRFKRQQKLWLKMQKQKKKNDTTTVTFLHKTRRNEEVDPPPPEGRREANDKGARG